MPARKPSKPQKPLPRAPGARNKVGVRSVLQIIDRVTGDVQATVRWRSHGELFVEYAANLKPEVVVDPKIA